MFNILQRSEESSIKWNPVSFPTPLLRARLPLCRPSTYGSSLYAWLSTICSIPSIRFIVMMSGQRLHPQCCILWVLWPFIVMVLLYSCLELGYNAEPDFSLLATVFPLLPIPLIDSLQWNCCQTRLPVHLQLGACLIIFRSYLCSGGGILQAAKTQNLEWWRYGELVCCDTAALLSSCFDGCSLRA